MPKRARLKALEATVARLQEQLAAARKDSSTSSKPPSSDIVKPPKPEPPRVRNDATSADNLVTPSTIATFPPEQITCFETHKLDACPDGGGTLRLDLTISSRRATGRYRRSRR